MFLSEKGGEYYFRIPTFENDTLRITAPKRIVKTGTFAIHSDFWSYSRHSTIHFCVFSYTIRQVLNCCFLYVNYRYCKIINQESQTLEESPEAS